MFDLEPVSRYRLADPPLVQALGQVRYPVLARLQTLEGIAPIQEALGGLFPYMERQQVQQVSLLVGPGGPAGQSQITQAWQFTDDDGWTLVIGPETTTLSVGPEYGRFEEFEDRFRAVVAALSERAAVQRSDRLGLRYVDLAQVLPGNKHAWRDWFKPELTGWSATSLLHSGTRVETSLTQTQIAAPPAGDLTGPPVDIQAIVRHGYLPANAMLPNVLPAPTESPAFLLDIDIFVEGHQPFDAGELTRQIGMLHDQIDRFFRWSLTPAGEAQFGLQETAQ